MDERWSPRTSAHELPGDILTVKIAAVCCALAAVASTLAAWKSHAHAKASALHAAEAEQRNLERDIEEIARSIEVESQRALAVFARLKLQQDAATALAESHGGGHAETFVETERMQARISEIQDHSAKTRGLPKPGAAKATDRLAPLPTLRAQLTEVRAILDNGLVELQRVTEKIAELMAQRSASNGE